MIQGVEGGKSPSLLGMELGDAVGKASWRKYTSVHPPPGEVGPSRPISSEQNYPLFL